MLATLVKLCLCRASEHLPLRSSSNTSYCDSEEHPSCSLELNLLTGIKCDPMRGATKRLLYRAPGIQTYGSKASDKTAPSRSVCTEMVSHRSRTKDSCRALSLAHRTASDPSAMREDQVLPFALPSSRTTLTMAVAILAGSPGGIPHSTNVLDIAVTPGTYASLGPLAVL